MTQDSTPTWQELLDLVTQLTQSDYETVAVSYGTISVRLSRTGELPGETAPGSAAPLASPLASPLAAAPAADSPAHAPAPDAAATAAGPTITAPMLGVFYRRPAPGADPFVQAGDTVAADTTIGIIEIMKLMNPVVAGTAGVIASFAVEDGTAVQFGQTLAVLEAP